MGLHVRAAPDRPPRAARTRGRLPRLDARPEGARRLLAPDRPPCRAVARLVPRGPRLAAAARANAGVSPPPRLGRRGGRGRAGGAARLHPPGPAALARPP